MPAGWISIHRTIRQHKIVGFGKPVKPCDPSLDAYSRSEAWQDLLMECRYEDGTVLNGGRPMELRRGELVGAVSYLAQRWNWTPKTVRHFLDLLEAEGMISLRKPGVEKGMQKGMHEGKQEGEQRGLQKGKQATVISVCNYEKYQGTPSEEWQANGLASGQAEGTEKGTQKGNNLIKENKINNIPPISPREASRASQDKGRSYWAEAMQVPGTYNPNEGVFRDPATGVLQLINGVRATWLERFGGDELALDLALIQAAPYVKPNGAHPIRTQVEAQLAKQLGWKAERAKADKSKQSAETPTERRRRLLAQINAEGAKR